MAPNCEKCRGAMAIRFVLPRLSEPGKMRIYECGRLKALRFAVEDMSAPALLGAYLESEEIRCGAREIRRLYESAAYPLKRRMVVREV